ncbi:MAG: hypothetical protein WA151_18745 [Desulfatirhabdiaceae bacterium]
MYADRLDVIRYPAGSELTMIEQGESVTKYSALREGRQIFASKCLQFLPSEQELKLEIEKELKMIEAVQDKTAEEASIVWKSTFPETLSINTRQTYKAFGRSDLGIGHAETRRLLSLSGGEMEPR